MIAVAASVASERSDPHYIYSAAHVKLNWSTYERVCVCVNMCVSFGKFHNQTEAFVAVVLLRTQP